MCFYNTHNQWNMNDNSWKSFDDIYKEISNVINDFEKTANNNKSAKGDGKDDAGKVRYTLVPRQIIKDIAEVREFGVNKYGNSDSWKSVDIKRYQDAFLRHFISYLDNPNSKDKESGLKHLKHAACNLAFLCELEEANRIDKNK